ncbi:MAG: hypothetical protein WDW38_008653 [Sanguina aurantia]
MGDKLMDQIFNLKFTAKQLSRAAVKCSKEEKAEMIKIRKAIEKGNLPGAKIYGQNCIRKKNENLNYMMLASRLDAVVSRLETQAKMQMVTKNMAGIVTSLGSALASNNLEKVAVVMGTFEKQFEDLDLQNMVVDRVMGAQAAMSTPEDEVNSLMQAVAEEHGLESMLDMPMAGRSGPSVEKAAEDDLSARLAGLRGK